MNNRMEKIKRNIDRVRLTARTMSILLALSWLIGGVLSGGLARWLPEVTGKVSGVAPGVIILATAALAWRKETAGGSVFLLEGLLVVIGYPLVVQGRIDLTTIIFVISLMGLPAIFTGLLFLVSGKISPLLTEIGNGDENLTG